MPDTTFVPPLKIGQVISNASLSTIFKVANMGGMRYSKTYDVLVLISNHFLKRNNPTLNPYDDKWVDGILYYTGMGNVGDQPNPPHSQNRRLYYENYSALYLFEVFRKGEYTYQGPVKLYWTEKQKKEKKNPSLYGTQHPNGIQPDKNGKYRKVWIFPIAKL